MTPRSPLDLSETDQVQLSRMHLASALKELDELPPSRQKSLAITKMEEASHWLLDLKQDLKNKGSNNERSK